MVDIGFDPNIALNHHIALLHIRDALVEEMGRHKGLTRAAVQGVGKLVMDELRRSRERMRANKLSMAETPNLDGRYRFTLLGRSDVHEISAQDLELYKQMAMDRVTKRLRQSWDNTK